MVLEFDEEVEGWMKVKVMVRRRRRERKLVFIVSMVEGFRERKRVLRREKCVCVFLLLSRFEVVFDFV